MAKYPFSSKPGAVIKKIVINEERRISLSTFWKPSLVFNFTCSFQNSNVLMNTHEHFVCMSLLGQIFLPPHPPTPLHPHQTRFSEVIIFHSLESKSEFPSTAAERKKKGDPTASYLKLQGVRYVPLDVSSSSHKAISFLSPPQTLWAHCFIGFIEIDYPTAWFSPAWHPPPNLFTLLSYQLISPVRRRKKKKNSYQILLKRGPPPFFLI